MGPAQVGAAWSLAGLLLFFAVLFTHKRWKLEPAEK
jgi:hypothetical protein